jgi:hypothetical protein
MDNDNKRIINIVDVGGDASGNNIIIVASEPNTINGLTIFTLNINYSSVQLVSNTDNKWMIV